MIRILFLISAFCFSQIIFAQEVFQRSYGGYGSDYGRAVIECSDGGYLVAGSTNSFQNQSTDVYLLRVNESGDYLWGKNIGSPNHIEWGVDLVEDEEGNFVIAGYTDATASGTYDGLLIKTNHNGSVIWQKTYGGNDWDFFESMALTPEGNLVVAGQKTVDGNAEGWLMMIDPNGDQVWENLIPGNGKVKLTGVDICPSGAIVFTGYTENILLDTKTQISGNVNMSGATIWAATYPEFGEVETGKCDCGMENQLFVPLTHYFGNDSSDIMVIAINSATGALNWEKSLELAKATSTSIAQKENGNVYFVGGIYGIGFADYSASVNSYSINGFYLPPGNTAIMGGFGMDILYDVKATSDKGLIVTGKTSSFGNNFQVHLCKIDSNGIYSLTNTDFLDLATKRATPKNPVQFSVYPNPANVNIHTDIEIKSEASYEIRDITGKILREGNLKSSSQLIRVSDLKNGMYFIQIHTEDRGILLSRFVKVD